MAQKRNCSNDFLFFSLGVEELILPIFVFAYLKREKNERIQFQRNGSELECGIIKMNILGAR